MTENEFKHAMAIFRVSRECIDHVLKYYGLGVLEMAIEAMGDPMEYVAEPDLKLLHVLVAITNAPMQKMPQHIPNNSDISRVKKSKPEYVKMWLEKIKKCDWNYTISNKRAVNEQNIQT